MTSMLGPKVVQRSSFYIYNHSIKCLKKFFYDVFGANKLREKHKYSPQLVAEKSIYETLHTSVIITSKNENNVY